MTAPTGKRAELLALAATLTPAMQDSVRCPWIAPSGIPHATGGPMTIAALRRRGLLGRGSAFNELAADLRAAMEPDDAI